MHHGAALCTMVHKGDLIHNIIFVVDNEHANQGSQCSSLPTYILVVHNVALYGLAGAQDYFACSLRTTCKMLYNMMLSISVGLWKLRCALLQRVQYRAMLCTRVSRGARPIGHSIF